MWLRIFTLDEANALLPEVRELMGEARRLYERVQGAEAHVDDLRIVWGDQIDEASCPDHGEYQARSADLKARQLAFHAHLHHFHKLGVEVKDVGTGLADFYALNGDKLVYLCWKWGEEAITAWHTLQGGFAARKPLPDFLEKGPST